MNRDHATFGNFTGFLPLAAAAMLLSFYSTAGSSAAWADPLTPSAAYGYQKYFIYHPPKEKAIKLSLYPFAGPIIRFGEDIPICAAAKTAAAYAKKTEI